MRVTSIGSETECAWFKEQVDAGKRFDVFLDGVEQRMVFEADEEAGYLVRAVLDEDGDIQTMPDKPDELWKETLRGSIEIRVRQESNVS